ncbi:MAG TPA: hypothetical protein VFV88_15905 [Steroidobacteraceae bacterium]|jgi:hypothetical protein|nr:hypothetical protein [Steroidobacteraceae bacterium]
MVKVFAMKNPGNSAKLLDLPYAPEAEQLLDELERTGQFRVGLEAEAEEEAVDPAATIEYSWGRGSGSVTIQDWWTTGRVALRVGPGIHHNDIVLAQIGDSLVVRTQDGLDRVLLEGYLGLIPDASTLRVIFSDGSEWSGEDVVTKISSRVQSVAEPGPAAS